MSYVAGLQVGFVFEQAREFAELEDALRYARTLYAGRKDTCVRVIPSEKLEGSYSEYIEGAAKRRKLPDKLINLEVRKLYLPHAYKLTVAERKLVTSSIKRMEQIERIVLCRESQAKRRSRSVQVSQETQVSKPPPRTLTCKRPKSPQ